MNLDSLLDNVSVRTTVSKKEAELAIRAALDVIRETMAQGGEVKLAGFGAFVKVDTKEKKARNPRTGEEITVPAGRRPKFKPAKAFLDAVGA